MNFKNLTALIHTIKARIITLKDEWIFGMSGQLGKIRISQRLNKTFVESSHTPSIKSRILGYRTLAKLN